MREATRRWAMRSAWAALLVAGSLLIGLRIGRPVYYTDGNRQLDGRELANAGMLQWDAPEVTAEVPGPVAGRIAALADGRLLYGRLGADGTADLVTWNPAQPAIPPEPVHGLNSPQNELAPAVAADGRIVFASDRDGGAGGYDLYQAKHLLAAAADVAPIPACRTALDEIDPALHPDGSDLVFVRSDRRVDGGNDGSLWRWRIGDAIDPAPVFAASTKRTARTLERDPVWSPDGAALWFVKKVPGERLQLVRASCHGGQLDEPLIVGARWPTGELRSPLPSPDGRTLALLLPRSNTNATDLWYASAGHEVYPWWPGQRWLEWILLGVVATSLLLLVLLHLGRRWSTLDLVAQCLLLSLLLHLLLYLWLMGVEIAGSLLPGNDDAGGFEVNVVTASVASASATAGSDVGVAVQFTPDQRELAADAPDSQLPREERAESHDAGSGAWERQAVERELTAEAKLADQLLEIEKREGVDATVPVAAAAVPAVDPAAAERAAAPRNQRSAAAAEAVAVVVPGSGVARATPSSAQLAASAAPTDREAPSAATVTVAGPALQDASAAAEAAPSAAKAGADAPVTAPSLAAGAAAVANAAPAAPAASRSVTPGEAAVAVAVELAPPGSALAKGSRAALAAPAAADATPIPASRSPRMASPAVALREALATAPAPAAAKPAASSSGAPALQPLAAAAAAPAVSTALPAARTAATGSATAETALPAPGSALVRANRRAPSSPAAVSANVAPTPRALPQPGANALPTGLAAAAAPTRRAEATAPSPAAALAPLAATAAAPKASSLPRLARASEAGAFAAREPAAAPPTSSLVQPRRTGTAAPAALPVAAASAYSNRFGPAKVKALEQFGGTDDTERAVANGLRYLSKIQNADGSWGDRSDYDSKYGLVHVGKTALCVLAFLGAGHTPQSNSEHSAVVDRALGHLLSLQDDNGAFGPSSCYGHGIATYALAECYGLTKRAELKRPLERALTWILDHQGPRRDRRNRGGWGYFSPGLGAEDDYARMSVSAWMIMALESARLSGTDLPASVLPAAREFVELAYDQPNGWFRYNHKPSRVNSAWPTLPASTPAGAFCLLLLGAGKDDPKVQSAVAYTVERRPDAYRRYDDDEFVLRGQGNVYFWYYGTLASFLAGGEAWAQWNERLRTVLPAAQAKDGSFPPIDVYAEEAGDNRRDRSYTTAMCVLCLEVYYRYFTPLLVGR